MSTPGRKNKRKETTGNPNKKKIRTQDTDQINRETSDVTEGTQEGTQEETQHEGILGGSTRNLTLDKLIMQNAELIKTCNTLNNKIDNLEKIIVEFIENKKDEISSEFVTKLVKEIADETFNKAIYPTQDDFKKISESVAKKNYREIFNTVDSSEELSLEVMMIDSLENENLLNNENNFESIHENSNEDEGEGENEDEDNDSYNAEVEEESLTSDISHSSVSFFENMELSNSEPENYSFNNYASDYNNICEEAEPIEFLNNAYADLIALVTNYNLSNEATNAVICFFNEHSNLPLSPLPKNAKKGRELMEKMKISTLTSKKHKILTHNNIDYYLFYHPVLNCIKNILSISDISQNFTLRFENFKYKGEKAYSEQYTGNWWKNTEASLPHGSNLLSIILYSDATTTDTLG
ncbi:hypothetical protein Glove_518g1 [Diversispora epigaea]|uniref:Uncharacterized protein n=1 Tax=Diversispora epigaea TaxID=1348612 RepID=A0A397GIW1_9GLOM|nr:hypothetical protein Glove_518g1 [Diversispora epigaea]